MKYSVKYSLFIILILLLSITLTACDTLFFNICGGSGTADSTDDLPDDGSDDDGSYDDGFDETQYWLDNIKYSETDIVFMMTKLSGNSDLSSGCERYLAGETDSVCDKKIDSLIAARNRDAYEKTKVNVTYKYYDSSPELYGLSRAYQVIEREILSSGKNTPDIYCNSTADLLACSLKGCFANIYSKIHGEGDYKGANHFNFANGGYMASFMSSLTLDHMKLFIIASDYFIDLTRSIYVIPVNLKLFRKIAKEAYPEVTEPTIDTLYHEVKPCECSNEDEGTECTKDCTISGWNYDRIIELSHAVHNSVGTDKNENDTIGFALGADPLSAAGLLYSSSVYIIEKKWNKEERKYNYAYHEENPALENLFQKISVMINSPAIRCISEVDSEGENNSLLKIRDQFCNDNVLFGGIVLLGHLEDETYHNMLGDENGGLGILPVPVMKTGDKYTTQIHTEANAGAIRCNTANFVQCSAFLHYQSTQSSLVLNEYYKDVLIGKNSGEEDPRSANIEMIRYIRHNLYTCMDANFEEAIGYINEDVEAFNIKNRYYSLLVDNIYVYGDIKVKYGEIQPSWAEALVELEKEYEKLPD